MPIGFDPAEVHRLTLDSFDKGRPERAVFLCRTITARQQRELQQLREQAFSAPSDIEADELINRAILIALTGWVGLRDSNGADVPFAPAALDDFTLRAKFAIASEIPIKLFLSDKEVFQSSSPSPAGTASSASPAPAVAAAIPPVSSNL